MPLFRADVDQETVFASIHDPTTGHTLVLSPGQTVELPEGTIHPKLTLVVPDVPAPPAVPVVEAAGTPAPELQVVEELKAEVAQLETEVEAPQPPAA